jgi:hypothetical protein
VNQLDESQRRYAAGVAKYGGIAQPVAVVPGYEGFPAFAFVALTLPLAKQRLLCWTTDEFIVFRTWGGEVPTTILCRTRRPVVTRVELASRAGHDLWLIAGRRFKVAQAYRGLVSSLDRTD